MRFKPTRYLPATRMGMDLTPLQRKLLSILAGVDSASVKELLQALSSQESRRTVQDNLQFLRSQELVELEGQGRAARWRLKSSGP